MERGGMEGRRRQQSRVDLRVVAFESGRQGGRTGEVRSRCRLRVRKDVLRRHDPDAQDGALGLAQADFGLALGQGAPHLEHVALGERRVREGDRAEAGRQMLRERDEVVRRLGGETRSEKVLRLEEGLQREAL